MVAFSIILAFVLFQFSERSFILDAANFLNNLARSRTILANERTFLAYIRTAIMLAVSGVTLIKLFGDELYFFISGIILLPVAIAFVGFGFIRYREMCRYVTKISIQETGTINDNGNCAL
jgi:putative membrane protein